MKSLKQALTMGLTGAIAVFTASFFGLPTWVLFMAWVSYYLFGSKTQIDMYIFLLLILTLLSGYIFAWINVSISERIKSKNQ